MASSDIGQLITEYCKNMDRQEELKESLFNKLPKKEWIEKLAERARELTEIAAKDEQILGDIRTLLEGDLSEAC